MSRNSFLLTVTGKHKGNISSQGFHECTKLAILSLILILYCHLIAISFFISKWGIRRQWVHESVRELAIWQFSHRKQTNEVVFMLEKRKFTDGKRPRYVHFSSVYELQYNSVFQSAESYLISSLRESLDVLWMHIWLKPLITQQRYLLRWQEKMHLKKLMKLKLSVLACITVRKRLWFIHIDSCWKLESAFYCSNYIIPYCCHWC